MWNDSTLDIKWEALDKNFYPILSEKDLKHKAFNSSSNYFDINGKWIGK